VVAVVVVVVVAAAAVRKIHALDRLVE